MPDQKTEEKMAIAAWKSYTKIKDTEEWNKLEEKEKISWICVVHSVLAEDYKARQNFNRHAMKKPYKEFKDGTIENG